MVTTMLLHFDQEERQTDGSRHWDSIKPVLMRASAHEGAQDSSDNLIHKGSTKKGSNIAQMKMRFFVISELFWDTLVVFRKVQNWWKTRLFHTIGKSTFITEAVKCFLSVLESGKIPGGEEKDRARQAVFLTPLNPLGKDPEEKHHFDYTVPQKAILAN